MTNKLIKKIWNESKTIIILLPNITSEKLFNNWITYTNSLTW